MVDVGRAVRTQLRVGFSVLFICVTAFTLRGLLADSMPLLVTDSIMTGLQWSAITSIVTGQGDVGATGKKALMRMGGTVLGGIFGVLVAKAARGLPEIAALLITVICSTNAFLFKCVGQIWDMEYLGQVGAIATILISWKGYTDPQDSVSLLFATRIGGICFGALVAQLSALVVFPTAASQEVQARILSACQQLSAQNRLVWDMLGCGRPADDAQGSIYDEFFAGREKVHDQLKMCRELLPQTKHERYLGVGWHGMQCWLPFFASCGRGTFVNRPAGLELVDLLREANRLLSTLFGVIYHADSKAAKRKAEFLEVLHRRHRHSAEGGVSALRKLRADSLDAWEALGAALGPGASPELTRSRLPSLAEEEACAVKEVVQLMLSQVISDQGSGQGCFLRCISGDVPGPTPGGAACVGDRAVVAHPAPGAAKDSNAFAYRWYTFLVLYDDLADLLAKVRVATAAWVDSLPHLGGEGRMHGSSSTKSLLQQPLLPT